MNRLEIIATFTALKELHKLGAHEGIGTVIDKILEEAETKSKDRDDTKTAD
jgi:hypothetical protein